MKIGYLILAIREGIWTFEIQKKWLANKFLKQKCEKCLKNKKVQNVN